MPSLGEDNAQVFTRKPGIMPCFRSFSGFGTSRLGGWSMLDGLRNKKDFRMYYKPTGGTSYNLNADSRSGLSASLKVRYRRKVMGIF